VGTRFDYAPINPNNLHQEYGPPPNDQRSRIVLSGVANVPWQLVFSPIWTMATGVPMDILLPGASEYVTTQKRRMEIPIDFIRNKGVTSCGLKKVTYWGRSCPLVIAQAHVRVPAP
jgi:hypothetical protein